MANKKTKIKRYRTMGAAPKTPGKTVVKVLLILLACGCIFAVGWFGASRCIDGVTGFWYKYISVNREEASSEPMSEASSENRVEDSASQQPEESVQPQATDAAGNWAEVSLSALSSEETLRTALQNLVNAGADHAVVTLKDERGYVYYNSAVELAATASAVRSGADVSLFARLCAEYGLTPCARLVAFQDPLASYGNRSLAVQYQQDGILWLDSSVELGGKPWLNPYSAGARQYVLDLAAEVAAQGVTDIVFAGVQFPQGYSLNFCSYGADTAAVTKEDCLRECVALFQSTLDEQGVRTWFEWPVTALEDGQAEIYTTPAQLGATRVLLTVNKTYTGEDSSVVPESDAALLKDFAAKAQENGTQRFGLNLTQAASDAQISQQWHEQAQAAGFTHFMG